MSMADAEFDESEIHAAVRSLERALAATDRSAWVYEYTEDAVFDGGHPVVGREALLAMAQGMRPMSDVSIRTLRIEGSIDLATVWFEGSWFSGSPEDGSTIEARGILVWRKESDGRWRVAMEHIG